MSALAPLLHAVTLLSALPFGPHDLGSDLSACPEMCCKAMTASCLACQLCVTVEEFCERAPKAFGCAFVHPLNASVATNADERSLDVVEKASVYGWLAMPQIKVVVDGDGFVYNGERNPVIRIKCNSPSECDIGLEIEQVADGAVDETCVFTFEDSNGDLTSNDLDYEFKETETAPRQSAGGAAARSSAKKAKDYAVAQRLEAIAALKKVPTSGPQREKAERFVEFLEMAREDKRKKRGGESVARKLIQTRRVQPNKQAMLMRVVTVCYTDELLDESYPMSKMRTEFKRWNQTDPGLLAAMDDAAPISGQMIRYFGRVPLESARMLGENSNANGEGGVVVDPDPEPEYGPNWFPVEQGSGSGFESGSGSGSGSGEDLLWLQQPQQHAPLTPPLTPPPAPPCSLQRPDGCGTGTAFNPQTMTCEIDCTYLMPMRRSLSSEPHFRQPASS